jgi:hypothetical protein
MRKDPLDTYQCAAGLRRHLRGGRHCTRAVVRQFVLACSLLVSMVTGPDALAQATGQLRLRVIPEQGMQYVLDGKHRMTDRELTLIEGAHRFTFWAPERRMLDTTFFVIGGRTQEVTVQLRYTPEYAEYRAALVRYERGKRWGRYLPPVVSAGATAWAVSSYFNYRNKYRDLDALREEYTTSADPAGIERLKQERIPEAKDDFGKARTQAVVSGSVMMLSLGATVYIRQRIARSTEPMYQDQERVRFEGLVYQPTPQGGFWTAGLTIPLR